MADKQQKMLIVVNPCAGRMTIKHHLLNIVNIFSEASYSVTVYPTKCKGDAEGLVLKNAAKYHTIVCCGGDGTLNETINGIIKSGAKVNLGYIPCGTLNEWSMGLGIAKNIVKAAKDIAEGNLLPLDVGDFNGKFFAYTASFGAFTEASYSTPQDVKNVLGQAAYIIEGMKSLGNIKPVSLTISTSERTISGDFLFGAVSNSLSVGGIVKYKDSAVKLNDGEFEVFLVRHPKNAAQLQSIISAVLTRNFENKHIEFFRAHELTVTDGDGVYWTLDGEKAMGTQSFQIKNIHNALSFYVPSKVLTK